MSASKSTILRDFAGGLNVVDDDLNLSSTYQPVLDNVHRGIDNALSVRWGTELFVELRLGETSTVSGTGVTTSWAFVSTTSPTRKLTITIAAGHAFVDGDHITFTTEWTNMVGLTKTDIINKPLGVRVVNSTTLEVIITHPTTVAGTDSGVKTFIRDNHKLAGDIIEIAYYNDHVVAFDNMGEIVKVNANREVTRIWDNAKAFASTSAAERPPPWSAVGYASTAIFKGKLLACNGVDKPLVIDFSVTPQCQYITDTGGSNQKVPVGKYICAFNRWVVIAGDPLATSTVHISMTDTYVAWEGDTDSDGTHLELNNTNSASIFIRGINKFRNSLAVAFDDTVTMIELGIFNDKKHEPNVVESIARHGSIAHKSMVFLGFDLIMADPIGIPSFAKSQFDPSIIPARMSELIAPMIQANINRLSPATIESDIFSVYSTHDSRYILFVPNYDNIPVGLPTDPIYHLAQFVGTDRVLLNFPNHGMEEGDLFTLNAVDPHEPEIPLPNPCTVDSIVSENVISFKLDAPNVVLTADNYGGPDVTCTRLKTETTAYAFTYNKNLKIKAWSRYRGWSFRAGCTSLYGRVFLATTSRIWRMGNRFEPIFSDFIGAYDHVYDISTLYKVGERVRDGHTSLGPRNVYTCMEEHTSDPLDPFSEARLKYPDRWKLFRGVPIKFAFEFSWADFDKRDMTKLLKTINVDAKGRDRFTVQMFLDYYYRDKATGLRTPLLSMDMVGGDEGAYGVYDQTYGTGRMAIRQRNWPFEARGKLFKMRIQGASIEPLRFVSFSFTYKLVGRDR